MIGLQQEEKLRDGGCYLKQHNEPDKNKTKQKHREGEKLETTNKGSGL